MFQYIFNACCGRIVAGKMYYILLTFLSSLTFVLTTDALNFLHKGACMMVDTQENFNIDAFQGLWYLQEGYNIEKSTPGDRCATLNIEYDQKDSAKSFQFQNKALSSKNNQWGHIEGTASSLNPGKSDGLFYSNIKDKAVLIWIVNTDYQNYALVYTCTDEESSDNFSVWLFTRNRNVDNIQEENGFSSKMWPLFTRLNLKPAVLQRFDQINCS